MPPEPLADPERLETAARQARQLVTQLAPRLRDYLNGLYGTQHDDRYWDFVLAPWLVRAVETLIDRLYRAARDSGNVRRPPPFRARAGRFGIRLRGYAGLHHGRHPESAVEPLAVFPPAETGLARRMDSRGTAARQARGRPDQTGKPLEAYRAEHPVQPALSPRQRVQPQAIVRSVRRAHAQPGPPGRHHPAPAARRSVRAAPASRIHGGRGL